MTNATADEARTILEWAFLLLDEDSTRSMNMTIRANTIVCKIHGRTFATKRTNVKATSKRRRKRRA
jgi:hypothetical protein